MPRWIVLYALTCVAALVLALILGWLKNRDAQSWAFAAFLFPPVVLILLLAPRRTGPRPARVSWEEDHRRTLARDDAD